jgi:hypothetical protein
MTMTANIQRIEAVVIDLIFEEEALTGKVNKEAVFYSDMLSFVHHVKHLYSLADEAEQLVFDDEIGFVKGQSKAVFDEKVAMLWLMTAEKRNQHKEDSRAVHAEVIDICNRLNAAFE